MTGKLLAPILALMLAAAAPPASQPAAAPQADQPLFPRGGFDPYKIVVEHNIFVRYHSSETRPRLNNDTSFVRSAPTPPGPAAAWVLTGIARESTDRVAFLENTQTNATLQVHAGQSFAAGRVAHIGLNFIELDPGQGGLRKVVIGYQLDGSEPPASMASSGSIFGGSGQPSSTQATSSSSSSTASSNPPTPPSSTDPNEAAILEKMRARRNHELGK